MHRLGQEDQNNFLTDQMSRFWLTSGVRAPGSAQKRHLEALVDRFLPDPSADARTPQNGVLSALFAPRSLQEGQRDRENKARAPFTQSDHFRNVRWVTRPPQVARSVEIALSWCRWTPTMALQMTLFGAPRGPNSRSKSKPRHLIGKKIILILLAKPMHRENASRRYKRV